MEREPDGPALLSATKLHLLGGSGKKTEPNERSHFQWWAFVTKHQSLGRPCAESLLWLHISPGRTANRPWWEVAEPCIHSSWSELWPLSNCDDYSGDPLCLSWVSWVTSKTANLCSPRKMFLSGDRAFGKGSAWWMAPSLTLVPDLEVTSVPPAE